MKWVVNLINESIKKKKIGTLKFFLYIYVTEQQGLKFKFAHGQTI